MIRMIANRDYLRELLLDTASHPAARRAVDQLETLEHSRADLLAALESVLGWEIAMRPTESHKAVWLQARAAIAKAKEQQ